MRFVPDYRVCYKGKFYECNEEFDIDPADANEMSQHGEIEEGSVPLAELGKQEVQGTTAEKPRRGRRRENDQPGADETEDE